MPKAHRSGLLRRASCSVFLILVSATLVVLSSRAQAIIRTSFLPLLFKDAGTHTGLRLLISEVVYDPPAAIPEPGGEWVEIYNFGGEAVYLSDFKVGDAENLGDGEGMFSFPARTFVQADTQIVVANRALAFEAWFGRLPDFEFYDSHPDVPDMLRYVAYATGVVSLSNGGDEIFLLAEDDSVIDAVSWGDSSHALNPAVELVESGFSLERWPANRDRDMRDDWIAQSLPQPYAVKLRLPTPTPTSLPTATHTPTRTATATRTATPTRTATATRTSSPTATLTWTPIPSRTPFPTAPPGINLLVSEVYFEQRILQYPFEWFELYNAGSTTLNLTGFRTGNAKSADDPDGLFLFPEGYEVAPGAVLLIASRGDYFGHYYGREPDFELQDTLPEVPELAADPAWGNGVFDLNPVDDEILILNADGLLVDAVCWGVSSFAFWPTIPTFGVGHTMARVPANQDTNTVNDWIDQSSPDPGEVVIE